MSRDEWVAGFQSNFNGSTEQANKIFDHLDKDKTGEICIDALYRIFVAIDVAGYTCSLLFNETY